MPVGETILAKLSLILLKLLTKPALVVGGWITSLVLLLTKDEKIPQKELQHRIAASILSIPASMGIDHYYTLDKWTLCCIVVVLGYFMWFILLKLKPLIDKKTDDLV